MSVHIASLGLEISARCQKAASDVSRSASALRGDVSDIERQANTAAEHLEQIADGGGSMAALQRALDAQQRTMGGFQREMESLVAEQGDLVERLSVGCSKVEEVRNDMRQLSHEANLLAVNTAVSAAQLGARGATVGCVARHMQDLSGEVAVTSQQLAERVTALRERLPLLQESSARLLAHTNTLNTEIKRIQDEFSAHTDDLRRSVSDALTRTRERAEELRTDSQRARTHVDRLDAIGPDIERIQRLGVRAMFFGTPDDLRRALTGDIPQPEGHPAEDNESDLDAGEMLLF